MSDDDRARKQDEIEKNLAYFLRLLPTLPAPHQGKFALLRHQEIVGYYDTVSEAVSAARTAYPDGIYSVQQVTDTPVNLGYYSHAVPLADAQ